MSTQDNPGSSSGVQQSLNIYSDKLIIEKNDNGGWKKVVTELPETDSENNINVDVMTTEVGKPKVEYPREREHFTVHKHRKRKTFRHSSSSFVYQYKVFDIQIDREKHPEEAKRLENVVDIVRRFGELDTAVDELESYDEIVENSDVIREYEATYDIVKRIWGRDSIRPYALSDHARDFEIQQYSQGFFVIPSPYHSNMKTILDEELKTRDLGFHSIAWGGFIVEPEDFSEVYEIVRPVYHTPDSEHALDMNKMR